MGERRNRMSILEAESDVMLAKGNSHKEIQPHFDLKRHRPLHHFLRDVGAKKLQTL